MLWLNDEPFVVERYPNGEARLPVLEVPSQLHRIRMAWRSDEDLMHLVFLREYLKDIESAHYLAGTSTMAPLPELEIEYMPYSRMDRSQNGSAFTLRYVCELINSLRFSVIRVWEPHSAVTISQLANAEEVCVASRLLPRVLEELEFTENDCIVLPDKGAAVRYGARGRWYNCDVLVMEKERDFATGRITSLKFTEPPSLRVGARALIIDDLCSYGGTFSKAAELLRAEGVTFVYLLVAHLEMAALKGTLLRTPKMSGPYDDRGKRKAKRVDGVFATESLFRRGEHEVGEPFEQTPTGYINRSWGTFVRLYAREEWR